MGARGTLQRGYGREIVDLHLTVLADSKQTLVEFAGARRISVGALLDEFARHIREKSSKPERATNGLPRKGSNT